VVVVVLDYQGSEVRPGSRFWPMTGETSTRRVC
jgi:hypothetical protein